MRHREESQEAADLDAVLAVDQALEVLKEGGVPTGSGDATVARLEKIHAEYHPAAAEDFRRRQVAVRERHIEDLKSLQAAMTKVGSGVFILRPAGCLGFVQGAGRNPVAGG
jgi:hypothetical protein